ncbi:MAG: hypothetical protein AMXMBFR82_10130 [Candidatus Hydrogenedentota bacterium]
MRTTVSILVLAFCCGTAAAATDWWDAQWGHRIRVDLDASILESDLVDFPVSLRLGPDLGIHDHAADNGKDLRIIDPRGYALDYETVRWDATMQEIHVRVPRIAARAPGQYFYLYYGNADAAAQRGGFVWDEAYRAVFHLAGDESDATKNSTKAQLEGSVGFADHAQFSQETGYLRLDADAVKGIGDAVTITMRFRVQEGPDLQTLASGNRSEGPEEWFNFGLKVPGTVHTNATSHGQRAPELNVESIDTESWHAAAVVYDAANHTRTIAVDGVVLERDSALPGALNVDEIRIGRGLLHFDPWQFHGEIDEVRIATSARSDAWIRAETGTLGERGLFTVLGPPQAHGEPDPPPGGFRLLGPADGFQTRSRDGVTLQWSPSAAAESYQVALYASADANEPALAIDAGTATSMFLSRSDAPTALWWTVTATSAVGEAPAGVRRSLTFYDWDTPAQAPPADAVAPALNSIPAAQYNLQGYLRTRIDKAIQRYLLETPESSPAILQVFRDRDKTPVRDPLVPWAGEFAGKYLTCAQLTWRLTQDPALKERIDSFVADLIACQADNGYLGPFPESSRLIGGNWDVWGHYHCMLGLMLYYEDTAYEPALDACEKAADLLFETFGPGGPTLTNDGAGGQMNMAVCHALVLLYKKTGVPRYLDLAKYIVHDAWNEPGAGRYLESALAGRPVIEFPQHRWEAIHDWQALAELYWLTGDEQYRKAFEHIWHSCLAGDRHNTGGITSGEGFTGTPYHQGAIETCCTVAWIAMSVDMLRMTGDSTVADEIEWSTLNSALGAIPYSGRACAYNVPMDGTRVFGVELPWQAPKAGPDLNCCAVNANRPLGMIGQWALMQHAEGLALNFYGPGAYAATLPSGNTITLTQDTDYPRNGRVQIAVVTEKPEAFTLRLRIPGWSTNTEVTVNGEAVGGVKPGTYLALNREWKTGDRIELSLDFTPRYWVGAEAYEGKLSVYRGPLLYAYDARYNDVDPGALPPVDWKALVFTPETWDGPIAPWSLMSIPMADGTTLRVCDLSSAGQTGNHCVTWLKFEGAPPESIYP